ncbi:MAG: metallophosphoesterase [Sphaerochaetaceae bacterium]|jgi:Icc-related predicted phosphoesterase|nr:metallophosphoesterase [Sphaerochaetaceae bacterium]MDD4219000.1 metallophosphoesterase [Sphaerochaetaceae bacterium]MDY0371906.1 metallophosphoesterase [Sphaerochaetaceae bacterium]
MKILCIADAKDPLVYSVNVAERYGSVDLVLSAGDLPLRYYEFIVSSLNKPFYFIFGNHHTEDMAKFKKCSWSEASLEFKNEAHRLSWGIGGECLEGKVMRDGTTGLLLAGLGGSMRYNHGDHQFTEFEMYGRILKMIPKLLYNKIRYGRFLDILVTHAPPRGIGDGEDRCHTGFKAFLWFMRKFKPGYLLHGHVHLIDLNVPRIIRYHETDVINVYGSYVLEKD